MIKLGVDLGGTKIEAAAIDAESNFLWRERAATPSGDYQATIDTIKQLLDRLTDDLALPADHPVGIATPGTGNELGLMKNCNSTALNGKPLLADLIRDLKRPVRMMNDANCLALSETKSGSASKYQHTFGVILGTGVGGGLVINNIAVTGANGIAGEWGHNLMPGLGTEFTDEQHQCYCGRINCIETYLCGRGLSDIHYRLHNSRLSAVEIAELSLQDDADARLTLEEYAQKLAMAIAQVINVTDPECVVLGGGLSNIDYLYNAVPDVWGNYIFSDHISTQFVKAEHGDSSGVRGAAWLWD